jgi:hypothetical protein
MLECKMDWINGILQAIKLPIKIIFGIVLFILVLFILPEQLVLFFGLSNIIKNYRGYFSLVFIGGIVFLGLNIFIYLLNGIKKKIKQINYDNNQKKLNLKVVGFINSLDSVEKSIIREFILGGKNTLELPITNASVSTLLSKNILQIAGSYQKNTIYGILSPIKLNEYIFSVFNPRMIDIPYDNISDVTEKDMYRFSEMRPDFIRELERFRKYLG